MCFTFVWLMEYTLSMSQAGVTDVKVVSDGFLSCGGDGTVKLVRLSDNFHGV